MNNSRITTNHKEFTLYPEGNDFPFSYVKKHTTNVGNFYIISYFLFDEYKNQETLQVNTLSGHFNKPPNFLAFEKYLDYIFSKKIDDNCQFIDNDVSYFQAICDKYGACKYCLCSAAEEQNVVKLKINFCVCQFKDVIIDYVPNTFEYWWYNDFIDPRMKEQTEHYELLMILEMVNSHLKWYYFLPDFYICFNSMKNVHIALMIQKYTIDYEDKVFKNKLNHLKVNRSSYPKSSMIFANYNNSYKIITNLSRHFSTKFKKVEHFYDILNKNHFNKVDCLSFLSATCIIKILFKNECKLLNDFKKLIPISIWDTYFKTILESAVEKHPKLIDHMKFAFTPTKSDQLLTIR